MTCDLSACEAFRLIGTGSDNVTMSQIDKKQRFLLPENEQQKNIWVRKKCFLCRTDKFFFRHFYQNDLQRDATFFIVFRGFKNVNFFN